MKDLKEIFDKQNGKCIYTGVNLCLNKNTNPNYQTSLDRIDNSKSYTKDNIQFCTVTCNWLKNKYDNKHVYEFFNIIKNMGMFGFDQNMRGN